MSLPGFSWSWLKIRREYPWEPPLWEAKHGVFHTWEESAIVWICRQYGCSQNENPRCLVFLSPSHGSLRAIFAGLRERCHYLWHFCWLQCLWLPGQFHFGIFDPADSSGRWHHWALSANGPCWSIDGSSWASCLWLLGGHTSVLIVTLYPTFIYPHLIKPWRLVEGQTVGQELDGFGTDVLRNTKVSLGRMLGKILYMKTFRKNNLNTSGLVHLFNDHLEQIGMLISIMLHHVGRFTCLVTSVWALSFPMPKSSAQLAVRSTDPGEHLLLSTLLTPFSASSEASMVVFPVTLGSALWWPKSSWPSAIADTGSGFLIGDQSGLQVRDVLHHVFESRSNCCTTSASSSPDWANISITSAVRASSSSTTTW